MNYTIYNPDSGKIECNVTWYDENITTDKAMIEGNYPASDFYIENGVAVAKPEKPTDNVYDFDYTTKTWQVNLTVCEYNSRNTRNELLKDIDKINPFWYSVLTDTQRSQAFEYRQALLDVPQQEGYPTTINWPNKPDWM